MGLESTMICLDNSEWMRNGDYIPTRLEAQHDAANLLCGAKIQSNPESTVGILTMAGKSVDVLVSPTEDMGKLLASLNGVKIGGKCLFSHAVQVAQLSLKHRRNKKGSQRIILFVGSPIEEDDRIITKLGKLLKKNNIAVDVVSFGNIDINQEKLQSFVDSVNSNNNSHIVTIPTGVLPSDVLVSSPVVHGGEGPLAMGGDGGSASNDFAEYGGIDPTMDPELALALRVSMEEERARQESVAKKTNEDTTKSTPTPTMNVAEGNDTSDDNLAKALAMSQEEVEDDDASMKLALAMSMTENKQEEEKASSSSTTTSTTSTSKKDKKGAPPPAPAAAATFLDPTFVHSLLSGLPGVDPNDPRIKAAMEQVTAAEKKDGDKKDKTDKKKDNKKDH